MINVPNTDVSAQCKTEHSYNKEKSNANDVFDSTGFVLISDVIPDAMLDIRYYSTYNFIGERVNGYEEPIALLSKEAANALKLVSVDLIKKGYLIKIFDAYRPQIAVDHFVSWAADIGNTKMKRFFYPELDKSELFDKGYIAHNSAHCRGSTVDLTLYDVNTGKEVDMGGPFDYFGTLSHPNNPKITQEQHNNRMILRKSITENGFVACNTEWWHFTLANEPYPHTYFSFPVSKNSLNRP